MTAIINKTTNNKMKTPKINKVTLNWVKTNLSGLKDQQNTFFYVFSRFGRLIYMGKAYKQKVKTRVNQSLEEHDIKSNGLTIWLGYIDMKNTTYSKRTKQIISDVECLQIYKNNPEKNELCTKNYPGRKPLRIVNKGCPLLSKSIYAKRS